MIMMLRLILVYFIKIYIFVMNNFFDQLIYQSKIYFIRHILFILIFKSLFLTLKTFSPREKCLVTCFDSQHLRFYFLFNFKPHFSTIENLNRREKLHCSWIRIPVPTNLFIYLFWSHFHHGWNAQPWWKVAASYFF